MIGGTSEVDDDIFLKINEIGVFLDFGNNHYCSFYD